MRLPKLYGLDKVNLTEKIYVVEGPIDSMFIDNSIAMAGADATKLLATVTMYLCMIMNHAILRL